MPSRSLVEAVVFDLDGVLLDSEQVWVAAKRELIAERGGTWKTPAEDAMLGMSSPEWSRYMRDELGLAMDPAEISREVVRLMMRHYRDRLPLMNGADGAVRSLAGEWPLAMASAANREIIDLVIELAGWAGLFAVTVSAEEVAHGKPEPDVYLDAVGRLGSTPGDCVAIEDSSAGIRSAAAAGLSVVAIPNRAFPPEASVLAQADLLLGSIEELDSGAIRRAASA